VAADLDMAAGRWGPSIHDGPHHDSWRVGASASWPAQESGPGRGDRRPARPAGVSSPRRDDRRPAMPAGASAPGPDVAASEGKERKGEDKIRVILQIGPRKSNFFAD
jgi:hypothetical protein